MLRIIGIGDNVVDRYLYKHKMYPGGNAVNVPVLAQRTGMAKAAYIGCLGTNKAGRHVLAALKSEGVDVSRVRVMEGENAEADVTLVDGDRVFVGGKKGVSLNIHLDAQDEALIRGYDLIHTSIYSGLDDSLAQMKAIGPKISYDYSDHLDLEQVGATLKYVDIAIFSGGDRPLEELKALLLAAAAKGPSQVLVTMGSRGSMLYCGGRFFQQGIYAIDHVVDTMGAGDSFIARYLCGYFAGEETAVSLQAAAEFAAKNCLVGGTFGYETEIG